MKQSDENLLKAIDKGCIKSLNEFQSRYRPRIKSIYYKVFSESKGFLRYNRNDLYEDIEMEVWAKFYQSRSNQTWYFDEHGSIGGLVHRCTSSVITDSITKAINNRSHLSGKKRKEKILELEEKIKRFEKEGKAEEASKLRKELKMNSMSYESFETHDIEVDTNLNFFDRMGLTADFTSKLQSRLTQEEQAVYALLASGSRREKILNELGLTIDQYRGRRKSIEQKAVKLQAEIAI